MKILIFILFFFVSSPLYAEILIKVKIFKAPWTKIGFSDRSKYSIDYEYTAGIHLQVLAGSKNLKYGVESGYQEISFAADNLDYISGLVTAQVLTAGIPLLGILDYSLLKIEKVNIFVQGGIGIIRMKIKESHTAFGFYFNEIEEWGNFFMAMTGLGISVEVSRGVSIDITTKYYRIETRQVNPDAETKIEIQLTSVSEIQKATQLISIAGGVSLKF